MASLSMDVILAPSTPGGRVCASSCEISVAGFFCHRATSVGIKIIFNPLADDGKSPESSTFLNMNEKYVLCIPRGCGFNDLLCQISEAHGFALKTGRTLLIDTRLSGLADSLSNYFELVEPDDKIILGLEPDGLRRLNRLSCFPREYEGRIDWIYHRFMAVDTLKSRKWPCFNSILRMARILMYVIQNEELDTISRKTGFVADYLKAGRKHRPIEFEKLEGHPADLIVHHMSGGGEGSMGTLGILRFKRETARDIDLRIRFLGSDYDAVHIRNTDYKSDFKTFLERIEPKLSGRRILLCTDDSGVISVARETLSRSEIVVVEKSFPSDGMRGRPLHHQWRSSKESIRRNNTDMFAELVGMSKARNLYYPTLIENIHKASVSGFSTLAQNLRSRLGILDRLMMYVNEV